MFIIHALGKIKICELHKYDRIGVGDKMYKTSKNYIEQTLVHGVCGQFSSKNHSPMRISDMVNRLDV